MKSRVLIIDDEETLRFTFERFLVDAGYEVATAKDFDEAYGEAHKKPGSQGLKTSTPQDN